MATSQVVTSWGDAHLYVAAASADYTMPTTLNDLGELDDNGFAITKTDGTTSELKNINGILLDKLTRESTIQVTATLLKINNTTKSLFWDTDETSGKLVCKSFIKEGYFAMKFENTQTVGSETFEAPKCKITMGIEWSADKGYTYPITIDILKGDGINGFFQMGTVAAQ